MGIVDESPRCHRLRAAPAAPTAPTVPADAHPDFARLVAYRSYVRIARVGDAADRFLVLADCSDASGQVYAVRPDRTVRWEADHVDATAAPRAVPADREAAARRVIAQHAADYAGVTGARALYLAERTAPSALPPSS
jgi:hypothetical protein